MSRSKKSPETPIVIEVPEQLLTTEEAARLLGMDPRTLNNWRVTRKNLPFVHVGSSVRYKMSDLQRYIAAQTVTVAA